MAENQTMPAPLPPEYTRFRPGQSGNPGGKTREQRQIELRNAEIATAIRAKMLEALMAHIEQVEGDHAAILRCMDSNALKLLKDAEDRGLGTPKASVDINNPGGDLKPEPVGDMVQELLKAIHK